MTGMQRHGAPLDRTAGPLPAAAQIDAAVTALRMLADPTRLRLLCLLTAGEHDVNSLAAQLGVARPAVSQHLAKLKPAGAHVRTLVTEALNTADHHVRGIPHHD